MRGMIWPGKTSCSTVLRRAASRSCQHCNGYGSSLREASDRCTRCGWTGLVPLGSQGQEEDQIIGASSRHGRQMDPFLEPALKS